MYVSGVGGEAASGPEAEGIGEARDGTREVADGGEGIRFRF